MDLMEFHNRGLAVGEIREASMNLWDWSELAQLHAQASLPMIKSHFSLLRPFYVSDILTKCYLIFKDLLLFWCYFRTVIKERKKRRRFELVFAYILLLFSCYSFGEVRARLTKGNKS